MMSNRCKSLYCSYVHFSASVGAIFYFIFYFFWAWRAYSECKVGNKDVEMHGQTGSGKSDLFSHVPS